jgi:hypothetical protein
MHRVGLSCRLSAQPLHPTLGFSFPSFCLGVFNLINDSNQILRQITRDSLFSCLPQPCLVSAQCVFVEPLDQHSSCIYIDRNIVAGIGCILQESEGTFPACSGVSLTTTCVEWRQRQLLLGKESTIVSSGADLTSQSSRAESVVLRRVHVRHAR